MEFTCIQKTVIYIYLLLVLAVSVFYVPHKIEGIHTVALVAQGGEHILRFDAGRAPVWVLPKQNGNIQIGELDSCGVSVNYFGILSEVLVLTLIFSCLLLLVNDRTKLSD